MQLNVESADCGKMASLTVTVAFSYLRNVFLRFYLVMRPSCPMELCRYVWVVDSCNIVVKKLVLCDVLTGILAYISVLRCKTRLRFCVRPWNVGCSTWMESSIQFDLFSSYNLNDWFILIIFFSWNLPYNVENSLKI